MPGLDSYSLDKYGIDTPASDNYQYLAPDIRGGTFVANGSLAGTVIQTFATFPAGTKIISWSMTQNWVEVPWIQINNGSGITASWALRDEFGYLWTFGSRINGTGSSRKNNLLHVSFDLTAGFSVCQYVLSSGGVFETNSATNWYLMTTTKPTNFNASGPLSLVCAIWDSTTTTSGQIDYFARYAQIISA